MANLSSFVKGTQHVWFMKTSKKYLAPESFYIIILFWGGDNRGDYVKFVFTIFGGLIINVFDVLEKLEGL